MNKIFIILQREYITRVRKRTFLLLTFLTPVLFGALFTLPVILALSTESEKFVLLLDETNKIQDRIDVGRNKTLKFTPSPAKKLAEARALLEDKKYYALVYVPQLNWEKPEGIQLYSAKGISMEVESDIRSVLSKAIERHKMELAGIKQEDLNKIKTNISINSYTATGEKSSSAGLFMFGMIGAIVIYFAIFLYGSQVMRGVVEEKTSRVVEVIISTVKPFHLMMGKILGVGLVGITQFVLWILLTFAIVNFAVPLFMSKDTQAQIQKRTIQDANPQTKEIAEKMTEKPKNNASSFFDTMFKQINLPAFIGVFLFYFVFGYLMYASLFAAAASAVDNESEMQQFVMPITIPLILTISMSSVISRDTDGVLAFWLSMFPLTSPIAMIIRYPFGVSAWQLGLSMVLLVVGFTAMVWLAGRIYRVGIMMYGKKVNYRELGKWIFYK
jgi:ABC-2 type transport system permease protein